METKYWHVKNTDDEIISDAAQIIKNGGVLAFPTETVYGLGADGLSFESVEKIFAAKGRPSDNPLILHIADKNDVDFLAKDIPQYAYNLMEKFWPGPLTVVLKKQERIPDNVTAGLLTVAIRMPQNEVALKLIAFSKTPIAAPSANLSGKPSPTTAKAVFDDMNGKIDAIIDNGKTIFGLESTVVDCSGDNPVILRPGEITDVMVQEVTKALLNSEKADCEKPKAPGMKYKHYAPDAPLYLFDDEKLLIQVLNKTMLQDKKIAVLSKIDIPLPSQVVFSASWQGKVDILAKNLYEWLRHFNEINVDIIFVQKVKKEGLGLAVMNRLEKAAGFKDITDENFFDE